jgi:hypothetical protein
VSPHHHFLGNVNGVLNVDCFEDVLQILPRAAENPDSAGLQHVHFERVKLRRLIHCDAVRVGGYVKTRESLRQPKETRVQWLLRQGAT